ncbi:ubinuclein-1-like isoform X2 [Cottoperca gobio]|uniref:Ubinuclein-1-like isoform X2 n=1 Tax=Cottoperca gobio TaxID=56716 RepID=A0A6J2S020_COTGO|nr:ubinuclein-1-like isoform X2 [Cottoperca gobio]
MAESRRVQLTTLSCDVAPAEHNKSPRGVEQEEERSPDGPADTDTVRLLLTLFEADERSFPEFNYSQLVDSKINHKKGEVPLSRFDQEEKRANDEVAARSWELEKKYGGKPKKKDRIQDLIDIGFGYDDEDSFIDNTEAYDEFVPSSITTKFGGFYVNSGVLHFRQASETEDLTAEEKTLEHSKKRKAKGGQDKPKKKSSVDPNSSTLSELGSDDKMKKKKKKKKAAGTLSVTSMLKKFQREKEKERQKMEKGNRKSAATVAAVALPPYPADAGGGGGSGLTDPLLSLIGSTNDHTLIQAVNAVDFDIDLDSLLDVSEAASSPKVMETQLFRPRADDLTACDAARSEVQPPNTETSMQLKPHSEQIQLLPQTSSPSPYQCVPLPEGLPPRLEDSVRKLTVVAKTSEGESKLKSFTPEINSILLDIELQCRELGVQLRSKVYTHLSSFLPCSRDTLLKRVKKLFLAHMEPPDVEGPMQKLKEAISRAMPEQIACFHEHCQLYEQVKASKATDEEKLSVGPEDNVEEKGGKRGGPKKVFKWNEEIRESLGRVLNVKMDGYKKEKGSQEVEEFLKTLLDNEVKPLWPKGWMQSRVLMRESRKMLSLFTPFSVKKARPEKKQISLSGPPATSDVCSVLQASPRLTESDDVIISNSMGTEIKEAALRKVEGQTGGLALDACSSTPAEAAKPPVNSTSAPSQSLLDLLADQALAREQTRSVSQELLAAAVAKYKRSVQLWSFGLDGKSPPFPPPPPQSSPVNFPHTGGVLSQLLQIGHHMGAGHVQIISDDDDDTTML